MPDAQNFFHKVPAVFFAKVQYLCFKRKLSVSSIKWYHFPVAHAIVYGLGVAFCKFSSFVPRMQDPNADTEWNDILRSKGILPPKEEATIDEGTVVQVRPIFSILFSNHVNC